MAKSRPALGPGLRHSEPISTRNSERFGTGGSEPFGTDTPVPNRFETAVAVAGRPPVLNDAQLLELAHRLNTELGRPPRADELIAQAGGCQRKRALTALQALRLDLAQRSVRSQLLFPPTIEDQLRRVMADWLGLASEHLAQRQAEFADQVDTRIQAASAHVEELQVRIAELQSLADAQVKAHGLSLDQIRQVTADRDQLRRDCDALRAVASERQRVIDQLVLGPAVQSAVMSAEARS